MPGKILVALEFNETGRAALAAAIALAKDLRATLVLVHVFQRAFMKAELPTASSIAARPPDREAQAEAADAEALATTWADEARAAGLMVETETPRGDTVQAVLDSARRHAATLVVVGTHGRTGLHRLVAGSVAEHVVRHSDRPVLVVPHKDPKHA
ncbi:MAG: hypothetical protein QOJ26_114 [Thermoplasmata archaeon]|jgi:nucleotide-binding universal stress UspA family protein|nr:hypothetical protein [Thermoplasmata archaeon]MEA3165270.1 hypothetical protein [Thermoplasmata archaeon]